MGSIQQNRSRKDGQRAGWRAMWVDHEAKQRSRTFARKHDAKKHLIAVEADLLRGNYVDLRSGQVTLIQYATSWMAAQVWRPSTRALAQSHLDSHIGPDLGDRKLAAITRTDVQGFVSGLTKKGLAPNTVRGIYVRLVSVFEAAVHDRKIAHSPAVKIQLPKVERTAASQVVVLDLDDVRRIADAAPPWLAAFTWAIATAGLRPGEAAGLTLERVDFMRRTISVDRQLITPGKGSPHLAPPKTASSVRTIPVGDSLIAELNRHMREHEPVELEAGATLLFTNRDGRPMRRNALGESWGRLRSNLELPAEARGWHSLRHTYASWLIEAGLSVKTVQARLGHASATETLEVYSHLWPDSDDDTRAAIESRLHDPLNPSAART
jgi:integrase